MKEIQGNALIHFKVASSCKNLDQKYVNTTKTLQFTTIFLNLLLGNEFIYKNIHLINILSNVFKFTTQFKNFHDNLPIGLTKVSVKHDRYSTNTCSYALQYNHVKS